MKNLKDPEPQVLQALVICGLLSADPGLFKEIESILESKFGTVALHSETFPFDWTDYYNAEMGEGILRRWLIFSPAVNLVESWRLKLNAGKIEEDYRIDGKRRINIDPGLIRLDGLWLFSTKPAGHRAYLDNGIWIELTLRFLREHCDEMPWTYPDHRDAAAQAFFLKGREFLKRTLHNV